MLFKRQKTTCNNYCTISHDNRINNVLHSLSLQNNTNTRNAYLDVYYVNMGSNESLNHENGSPETLIVYNQFPAL